jgi:hypothetical protein
MKSSHAITAQLLPTSTMSPVRDVYRGFDDGKKRVTDALTLSTLVAAILVLYTVLFASAYLWSRYAPIFSPDFSDGPAIAETIPSWQ